MHKQIPNEVNFQSEVILRIFEELNDGIAYYDASDRLVFFNSAFKVIHAQFGDFIKTGITFEDIVDEGLRLDVWDLGELEPSEFKRKALEDRLKDNSEAFVHFKDGRWIMRRELRTADGGMVGFRTDVTNIKEQERELVDAQQSAEAAARAKSDFLANMSHEIRTPMNGVIGMAELLVKTELDTKQKMFADIIVKSGTSLLTVINDVLDFSKLSAGQMTLDPASFDVRESIEDVAALISGRANEKGIELAVRVAPDVPEHLIGDVGRLRQIATNLMGNAVKFTDEGHVLAEIKALEVTETQCKLLMEISDTGVGIPKDQCSRVFEQFSQVDSSATRKHEGTGLGLSICASLVKLMNGEIGVRSEVGKGSVFWVRVDLPVDRAVQKVNSIPFDLTGSQILVVDDNSTNRSILAEQISHWGFGVGMAASGKEALQIIAQAKLHNVSVDAIVLDYQMPDMCGAEVATVLRKDPRYATVPILMLTSVDQLENGEHFSSIGVTAHLTKPARSATLRSTLLDIL